MANFDWNDADSADLIQKVFTGDINIANLPIELYEKTANYLTQGVYDVYGIGYDQSIMAPEFETIRHLKANIHVFSAAKTFQSILDIQSQLFDDDGNIRSFRDFEQRASKIESLYNKAWLRAEYRTTINQARSAKNWDRYSSQKNTFPYLRYETKDDSKVRPEHASMDGITLPVDHPFWNQYFPPNGWNCRCTITQIRKATSTKLDQIGTTDDGTPEYKDVTLPDQLFRLNSGKHQVIFVDDKQKGLSHPYFKVDTRYKAYQDRNFDMPIPNDVKDLVKTAGEIKPPVVETKTPKFKTIDDAVLYAENNFIDPKSIERINKRNIEIDEWLKRNPTGKATKTKPVDFLTMELDAVQATIDGIDDVFKKYNLPKLQTLNAKKVLKAGWAGRMSNLGNLEINAVHAKNLKRVADHFDEYKKTFDSLRESLPKLKELQSAGKLSKQHESALKFAEKKLLFKRESVYEGDLRKLMHHELGHHIDNNAKIIIESKGKSYEKYNQLLSDAMKQSQLDEYKYKISSYAFDDPFAMRPEIYAETFGMYHNEMFDDLPPKIIELFDYLLK